MMMIVIMAFKRAMSPTTVEETFMGGGKMDENKQHELAAIGFEEVDVQLV